MSEFIVKTDYFEGPFDLLLFLVKKHEMEIEKIELSIIISDYLEYLKSRESINVDREVDFLEVASTLILLKSKALIPSLDESDEISDETELLYQLEEFAKIRNAVIYLFKKGEEGIKNIPVRVVISEGEVEYELKPVTLYTLSKAFFYLLKTQKIIKRKGILEKKYELKDKIDEIMNKLKNRDSISFFEIFHRVESLEEAFFVFFALLELIKRKKIIAFQREPFSDIIIFKRRKRKHERVFN